MTTEATENVSKDRDISVLIGLKTYQDMTDSEIEKVIEYKIERALTRDEVKAYRLAAQNITETGEQAMASILESSESVLKSIIASATDYQGVTQLAVTDLLTEKGEV